MLNPLYLWLVLTLMGPKIICESDDSQICEGLESVGRRQR